MKIEKQAKVEEQAEVKESEFVEGFALRGTEVASMKDKSFLIVSVPTYETSQDLDNTSLVKRKLTCMVKVSGFIVKYYPNKTSQDTIIAAKGRRLADWVGYQGKFYVIDQKVGKEQKKVIYIEE